MNVIEIDAASNNGVDNIREIREEVAYRPTQGKYKVYIIDEVHMLSTGAFNALLKTLEEPPSYVIFILATTEAHSSNASDALNTSCTDRLASVWLSSAPSCTCVPVWLCHASA